MVEALALPARGDVRPWEKQRLRDVRGPHSVTQPRWASSSVNAVYGVRCLRSELSLGGVTGLLLLSFRGPTLYPATRLSIHLTTGQT